MLLYLAISSTRTGNYAKTTKQTHGKPGAQLLENRILWVLPNCCCYFRAAATVQRFRFRFPAIRLLVCTNFIAHRISQPMAFFMHFLSVSLWAAIPLCPIAEPADNFAFPLHAHCRPSHRRTERRNLFSVCRPAAAGMGSRYARLAWAWTVCECVQLI